ncbi:MAG: multidrug transporter [Pseudomonadales bacterium]|nr:multidrug transporter [Pseudomonadales bacterium]
MEYEWIAGIFVGACIVFLVVGLATLARNHWFLAWLRGSLGFSCLLLALLFGLLSINIFSYKNLIAESPVATISFTKHGNQEFSVTLVQAGDEEQRFRVTGDLWQVDAKVIKWDGLLASLGFSAGYKLDRLQGRYIALEDERSLERTVYALSEPDVGFDLWEVIQTTPWLPWVDAVYGSATYLPMADGAIFSVSLSSSGLVARPMNERAESAVNDWN